MEFEGDISPIPTSPISAGGEFKLLRRKKVSQFNATSTKSRKHILIIPIIYIYY